MISYHFIVQSCYNIIDLIPYMYLISLRSIYPITGNMYLLILFYFDQNPSISKLTNNIFFSVFEFVSVLFSLVSFLDSICKKHHMVFAFSPSLSSPSGTTKIHMLLCMMLSQKSLTLTSFLKIISSSCNSDRFSLIFQVTDAFFSII